MQVHLATDHRGFELKEVLKRSIEELGSTVIDHGNTEYDATDDYPDFASTAVRAVVAEGGDARGIVLCGSGVGVSVVANKIRGARCVLGFDAEQVEHARQSDDCTILALPADYLSESTALELVRIFLETQYDGDESDRRRLQKVSALEK
ncbi:RpiB/LacA/LacB family sugar-phosphate isomerase [Candidatus Woesebacteria bacterium]|nr:RpiB/LacA/LacB family sugar-phosphate isomerase [Candidatus Woesebacteria bacterium]